MTEPLFHPGVAARLTALYQRPPQALLLCGPAGIGKTTVANWLISQILQLSDQQLTNYPHILGLQAETGKTIGIEAVRELEHFISLKTPQQAAIQRIVMISDAEALTLEAQNALLKTLEEPPADTMLLLTSAQPEALLPTIRSRLQNLTIVRPAAADLQVRLTQHGVGAAELQPIMALSGGLPGLAFALADNDQAHPLVIAAQTARQLLQQTAFEKLALVDTLAKDRQATRNVLYIMLQMSHTALLNGRSLERWQKIMQASYAANQAINRGVQPKLALANLMLNQ